MNNITIKELINEVKNLKGEVVFYKTFWTDLYNSEAIDIANLKESDFKNDSTIHVKFTDISSHQKNLFIIKGLDKKFNNILIDYFSDNYNFASEKITITLL